MFYYLSLIALEGVPRERLLAHHWKDVNLKLRLLSLKVDLQPSTVTLWQSSFQVLLVLADIWHGSLPLELARALFLHLPQL